MESNTLQLPLCVRCLISISAFMVSVSMLVLATAGWQDIQENNRVEEELSRLREERFKSQPNGGANQAPNANPNGELHWQKMEVDLLTQQVGILPRKSSRLTILNSVLAFAAILGGLASCLAQLRVNHVQARNSVSSR